MKPDCLRQSGRTIKRSQPFSLGGRKRLRYCVYHLLRLFLTEIEGCYVIGGDNEIGITHGHGLGLLAELVTTGQIRSDISAYRVGRAMS